MEVEKCTTFHTSNIRRAKIFLYTKLNAPPEGRSLTDAASMNGGQCVTPFRRVSAISRPRRLFSPHSFLARQKRMGLRSNSAQRADRDVRPYRRTAFKTGKNRLRSKYAKRGASAPLFLCGRDGEKGENSMPQPRKIDTDTQNFTARPVSTYFL